MDFSTIRDLLEKGGVVLYTVKCPNCGAPLELPERGSKIRCEHCGVKKLSELL